MLRALFRPVLTTHDCCARRWLVVSTAAHRQPALFAHALGDPQKMFEAQLRFCTVECPLGFGATVPGFPQDFGDFEAENPPGPTAEDPEEPTNHWCFVESVGRDVPKNGVKALPRKVRASALVAIGALYGRTDNAAAAGVLLSQLERRCRVAAVQCGGLARAIIPWHRDGVGLFATSSALGTQLMMPISHQGGNMTWEAELHVVDEYHLFSDELCEGVALRELHSLCMRDRKPSILCVQPVSAHLRLHVCNVDPGGLAGGGPAGELATRCRIAAMRLLGRTNAYGVRVAAYSVSYQISNDMYARV